MERKLFPNSFYVSRVTYNTFLTKVIGLKMCHSLENYGKLPKFRL